MSVFALAAGGTGGHMFPAQALADVLHKRGHAVHLITDARGKTFSSAFAQGHVHAVASETLRGRSFGAALAMLAAIVKGVLSSRAILKSIRADALVAFGGYPSVPPGLAAWSRGLPVMLHEQNAVMGRANRILAGRSTRIATGFASVAKMPSGAEARATKTGNPVRPAIIESRKPYVAPSDGRAFNLLVFGGSQGAAIFSAVVPNALMVLPQELKARLKLVQQCRPEDLERVKALYADNGIDAELQSFFTDMPERLAAAHLVIARAGASTVGELAAMGRPCILVPLPGALDQDQKANATVLEGAGGARMILQPELTQNRLKTEIAALMAASESLASMAAAASAIAENDAAERLADLAEQMITQKDTAL